MEDSKWKILSQKDTYILLLQEMKSNVGVVATNDPSLMIN